MFGLSRVLEEWMIDRKLGELQKVSNVTIENIERLGGDDDEMDLVADSIGLAYQEIYINIYDKNGLLLGDSQLDVTEVEQVTNSLPPRDIEKIKANYIWSEIRFNKRLNDNTLVYFREYSLSNRTGFIQISAPMTSLNASIDYVRFVMTLFAILAILYEVTMVAVFSRTITNITKKERESLEQRVIARTREIEYLQKFTSMLAACHSYEEVQQTAAEVVPKIIGDVPCNISLLNEKNNIFESKLTWGGNWLGKPEFVSDDCWAIRKGRYHLSQETTASLNCNHMDNTTEEGCLCVPLVAQAKTFGVMHIMIELDEYDTKLDIIFTLAENFSLALANIDLKLKLKKQAILDPLTKLFNRRQFDQLFEMEINRCLRHKMAISILLMDIDFFKKLNDTFGHDAGDFVLKKFASTIKQAVRKEDMCFRIGGEEFVVLLPNIELSDAEIVANKLIEIVNEEKFFFNGYDLGEIGVSIGIANYSEHASSPKELLKCADLALYEAKETGRNKAIVAKSFKSQKSTPKLATANIKAFTKKN